MFFFRFLMMSVVDVVVFFTEWNNIWYVLVCHASYLSFSVFYSWLGKQLIDWVVVCFEQNKNSQRRPIKIFSLNHGHTHWTTECCWPTERLGKHISPMGCLHRRSVFGCAALSRSMCVYCVRSASCKRCGLTCAMCFVFVFVWTRASCECMYYRADDVESIRSAVSVSVACSGATASKRVHRKAYTDGTHFAVYLCVYVDAGREPEKQQTAAHLVGFMVLVCGVIVCTKHETRRMFTNAMESHRKCAASAAIIMNGLFESTTASACVYVSCRWLFSQHSDAVCLLRTHATAYGSPQLVCYAYRCSFFVT